MVELVQVYRKMKTAMMAITMVWMMRIQLEMEKRDIVAVVLMVVLLELEVERVGWFVW